MNQIIIITITYKLGLCYSSRAIFKDMVQFDLGGRGSIDTRTRANEYPPHARCG